MIPMPEIRQLPPSVINKIAAGEVIERPASVAKELLENAIDAGATRIDLSVEKGGSDLIRLADNGCGIASDQLLLSVASHATSKIGDADDLFSVETLGFRGEALASIAEVSQFRIRSRVSSNDAGAELTISGGTKGEVAPCACGVGTTVEVRNLFFNTPVRRKFLRTTQTEMGHITESLTRIALSYNTVHFVLEHNGRELFNLPANEDFKSRIAAFFGSELSDSLIEIDACEGPIRLSGYVANPSQSRGNNRMQYLFLNGRFIRDRSLMHALGESYRGLLMTGRYPIVFLHLDIPPDTVDVNVHPTKLEVRFQDGGQIYSQILGTLRNRFLTTDLTARVSETAASPSRPSESGPSLDPAALSQQHDRIREWARGEPTSSAHGQVPRHQQPVSANTLPVRSVAQAVANPGLPLSVEPDATAFVRPAESNEKTESGQPSWNDRSAAGQDLAPAIRTSIEGAPALQVHDRYLITENDDGLVVIDQHALHERILYEELREKVMRDVLESQRLLVPEPVQLTAAEAATVLDSRELLSQLGIDVEDFGGDTVLVSSYPAMLANLRPDELLRQLIEKLMSSGQNPDRRDVLDELLHMISCKAAVKAGDRLSPEEVSTLVERRHMIHDSHHCPHGRPTALVFTRQELDRRFGRT